MTKKINNQFLILQSIAIILVVYGHRGGGGVNFFQEWFPVYSFHMPLFIFISGYFYKSDSEDSIKKFILKKIKRLVIPYFIWNLIYGIIINMLRNKEIVKYPVNNLSLKSLFISPWQDGHQFLFNLASWFVLALFLIEIIYLLFRKLSIQIRMQNEYLILFILLALGLIAIIESNKGYNTEWNLTIFRTMFLIPFYHMGYLYKQKIEEKDNANSVLYFCIIFIIQFVIIIKYNNKLDFSAVFLNSFNSSNILLSYITSATGIMFWLRISKILTPSLENSKFIKYIGTNTWTIMMHHIFTFWMINFILSLNDMNGFNYEAFKTNIWYAYTIQNSNISLLFYIFVGVSLPLLIKYCLSKVKNENKLLKSLYDIF